MVAFGVAIQSGAAAEKKKASPTATGSIKLLPLGLDGQRLTRNSDLLWRKITSDIADKNTWHDAKTDTWWRQVTGFSTSGDSKFSELDPGIYRVTVRDGHDEKGALGIGEPVVINAQHQTVLSEVRLIPGTTLHVSCTDANLSRRLTSIYGSPKAKLLRVGDFLPIPSPANRVRLNFAIFPPGSIA